MMRKALALSFVLSWSISGTVGGEVRRDRSEFLTQSSGTHPLKDGEKLYFRAAVPARLKYARVAVIGNQNNIKTIFFAAHGDHATDLFNRASSRKLRAALKARTPRGEGAYILFLVSQKGKWPGFNGGRNGHILFEMFQALNQFGGNNPDTRFEQYALSGGGRLNHALMDHVLKNYRTNPAIKQFVDRNFKAIHDGESIGYARRRNTQAYLDLLTRFPHIRASFMAGPIDGKMDYVYPDSHIPIARKFGGKLHVHKRLWLQDGRIRFIPVTNHFAAWWEGMYEGFLGRPPLKWKALSPRMVETSIGGSGRVAILYAKAAVGQKPAQIRAARLIDQLLAKAGFSHFFVFHRPYTAEDNELIAKRLQRLRSLDGVGGLEIMFISRSRTSMPKTKFFKAHAVTKGKPDPRFYSDTFARLMQIKSSSQLKKFQNKLGLKHKK